MPRVPKPRAAGCLDLDREQAPARLDHQVHLLADRRAPIENLHTIEARVAPGQEIVEHEILEVSPAGLFACRQMQRQSGVAPVELWRLDEALGAVYRVGGQTYEQARGLEQVQVTVH